MSLPLSSSLLKDHGIMVPVSESRGSLVTRDAQGRRLFVAVLRDVSADRGSRASLLIADLENGESHHYFFPDRETMNGDSYCIYISRKHRVYLSVNRAFFEFDLMERTILYSKEKLPGPAMSMAEAEDGRIYFAVYPTSELFEFQPDTGALQQVVQLDPLEKYPTSMAIDSAGWIYVGLGMVQSHLVAYQPTSGQLNSLSPTKERSRGAASVVQKANGEVYGAFREERDVWMRFFDGKVDSGVSMAALAPEESTASLYWFHQRWFHLDGFRVTGFSLDEGWIEWEEGDNMSRRIPFQYHSEGAAISSFQTDGNGTLHGCSSHPMQMWRFHIASGKSDVLGAVPKIGNGNFPKLLSWNGLLVGNSYSLGDFYRYNPLLPVTDSEAGSPNPEWVASSAPCVIRPRALALHPDGRHVISSGFPDYGCVGGGMLIYDLAAWKVSALLSGEQLLPEQTMTSLAAHPGGNLLFGCSTLTPGGANPIARDAVIGEFGWKEQRILWTEIPVPGAREILAIHLITDEIVAGITAEGVYFTYDLTMRTVIHSEALGVGAPAGNGDTAFVSAPDGALFLVMRACIFQITHAGQKAEKYVALPTAASAVGPIADGKLFYASGSHLWSCSLPVNACDF